MLFFVDQFVVILLIILVHNFLCINKSNNYKTIVIASTTMHINIHFAIAD